MAAVCRVAGLLLLGSGTARLHADTPDRPRADLPTFDALVGRWMDLRAAIADEARTWIRQREQWNQEIRLLEQEQESLRDEIEARRQQMADVERQRAQTQARKDRMDAELDRLREHLVRSETRLHAWEARIPESLRAPLASGFQALHDSAATADTTRLTQRVRNVVTLWTQIETLLNTIHATREMLDVGGGRRRQADVLYIGLARGFAVTADNDWAAVGQPGASGWEWTAHPDEADAFRRAIEVFNRRQTARLVHLPMRMAGETAP